jgi:hypothetical protein
MAEYQVGQNLFTATGNSKSAPAGLAAAVKAWYSEVADLPPSTVSAFNPKAASPKDVGHYTQNVWATTKEVGCGYTMWQNGMTYKQVECK